MFYYLSAFLELLKFYFLFKYGYRITVRKKIVSRISVVGIMLMYSYICVYAERVNFYIYLIWISLELMLLFEYNLKKLLVFELVGICFVGMLDSLSLICIQILNISFDFGWEQTTKNVFASLVTIIFLILVFFVILKKDIAELNGIRSLNIISIFSIGLLYSLILAIIWDKFLDAEAAVPDVKIYMIFLFITLSAYYQLIILLKLEVSNKKLQKKDCMNQYLLQLQEKQYLYLENTERETKKFRHDVKNHMFILSSLCKKGDLDEATEYINQTWGKMELISSGYHVNHNIVDAILNQYVQYCKHSGINFLVKGYLPTGCKISSYDIGTIFSNILQNAFEAASVCDNKVIDMTLRFDDVCIYIQEENTYSGDIKVKGGKFVSEKEDTVNHGFGMENVKECILKYHGNWTYKKLKDKEGEKSFLLQIMLYNKQYV
ncbi:MAG: sensor histidine kinase [Lachnotalea sp.]